MNSFYLDENTARGSSLAACRRLSLDVLGANEARMLGQPDPAQLAFATSSGRVLVTGDRGDFSRIHIDWLAENRPHSGIVLVVQFLRLGPGEFARRLNSLVDADLAGQLIYLPDSG